MKNFFSRNGSSATAFLFMGTVWFFVGAVYGLISATDLIAPELLGDVPFMSFGRVRPAHVDTMLFGFVTTMLWGCAFYILPALLQKPLWSEPLGWVSVILWNAVILSGPIGFGFGWTQGREYSEYEWIFDILLEISVALILLNFIMTIFYRREKTLYVSVWYFTGTPIWLACFYFIGNVMWHPVTGAIAGIEDSILLWFYGHTLPGLLLTPLAVGAAYYIIPRIVKEPLHSHTISLVGFWTLIVFYTHIGGHHIVQAPIPAWLKVISTIHSMAMVIPVIVVLMNLWLTARGRGGMLMANPGGRFVIIGTIWYIITCIQGPLQSLPMLQRVTHFNNWEIGHSHIAVLGFSGFIALGTMWYILPLLTKKELYSWNLVSLQFGLLTIGLTGFLIDLTVAGLIQGSSWNNGHMIYRTLPQIMPEMIVRAGFGIMIFTGSLIGLINFVGTVRSGKEINTIEGKV
jgi:cbb3-type cytochrome c oxidase subunit I